MRRHIVSPQINDYSTGFIVIPIVMCNRLMQVMLRNVLSFMFCLFRNLLDNQQDLNSDGEDEDEFVPSKKELQSSEEEDEEEDEGEEEAGLDSDDEVVAKRGRRAAAAGTRTPRTKQKTRSSTRTPRKTPNKKVKVQPHRCFLKRWI